ncbi:hypothetical protein [Streptomyces sp. RFCAC02]|uniref:hypothetical protein n=1 Tax=Streptomyces sp. RFCAC02 TaxID=2499143 RepID=UPI001020AA7B|nr:hypothetical protein [Streptomyces sp. RFCAC02]
MLDDELDAAMRGTDPLRGRELPAADSPYATRIMDRARAAGRRAPRRRRVWAIPLAAGFAVAGATAAALAWVAGDGAGHALDTTAVDCKGPNGDAHIPFNAVRDDPADLCRTEWNAVFAEPAPDLLTACVDSSAQGSIQVYPGGRDVCAEHRADPYAGVTDEQLAFARLRLGVEDLLGEGGWERCLPREEVEAAIDTLLADNGLTDWTLHTTVDDEHSCWHLGHYFEDEREIWIQPAV